MAVAVRRGEDERLVLGLLESVEQDGAKTQRRLAAELGIAVGLVNAYLNRCIQKGLVKVTEAPARRYAYYLTPQGFVEKSRLSLQYLTYSFRFFRQAKIDCLNAFQAARELGIGHVALSGVSDLAETSSPSPDTTRNSWCRRACTATCAARSCSPHHSCAGG